ncbi:MAG TPA: RNase adapter RapZ [Dongiaceae bacterium]|nr:RNase adapter RapZ [Dongiaceae bacterium]
MDSSTQAAFRDLYRRRYGVLPDRIATLHGDASNRRLFRVQGVPGTVIGVHAPDPLENRAFLSFSRTFRAAGLPVPEIYGEDAEAGVYLEEDLGDATLFDTLVAGRRDSALAPATIAVYREVLRLLPRFQIEAGQHIDYSVCYPRASFDHQSMLWDLNYFKYYFLKLAGVPFSEQALEDDFELFAERLLTAPREHFLYRDFQSRNIMVRDGKPWFIDYQGGRRGALQYDVASILFDAKADLPFELRGVLLEEYLQAAEAMAPLDRGAFMALYPLFAYVRIFQALGAYGLRGYYERKARFLQSIPYAIRNLERLSIEAPLPANLPALGGVVRWLVGSSALRQIGNAPLTLTVRVSSFSYRDGFPTDYSGHGGGWVFDCRFLPNPGREERFAALTGRDPAVVAFLEVEPAVGAFLDKVKALADDAVDNYRGRNFTDLSVAFGCTGGRHRSVYCAERLAEHLRGRGVAVEVRHREIGGTS